MFIVTSCFYTIIRSINFLTQTISADRSFCQVMGMPSAWVFNHSVHYENTKSTTIGRQVTSTTDAFGMGENHQEKEAQGGNVCGMINKETQSRRGQRGVPSAL